VNANSSAASDDNPLTEVCPGIYYLDSSRLKRKIPRIDVAPSVG